MAFPLSNKARAYFSKIAQSSEDANPSAMMASFEISSSCP